MKTVTVQQTGLHTHDRTDGRTSIGRQQKALAARVAAYHASQRETNARLIATLLEACLYAEDEQNKQGWLSVECWSKLRDAIAAATSSVPV